MTQRKTLIILWLVLWAEATRPGEMPPLQSKLVVTGEMPPLQAKGDTISANLQSLSSYQDAPARKDGPSSASLVDKRELKIGKELVHRGSDLDISYLQSLENAWNVSFNTPLLDRAEALGLARAAHGDGNLQVSLLEGREVRVVNEWRACELGNYCCDEEVQCPAHIRGVGQQEGLDGVEWRIKRHQSTAGGAFAGLAIAGGASLVRALWGTEKPFCPRVEFHKVKKKAGFFSKAFGTDTEQSVKLQDLTLAMTIQFVQEAMSTDEDEAHDFKTDVTRNGKGIFACNVLMYHSKLWDGKLTNSELYTVDGPRDETDMNEAERAEENFMRALKDKKPKERALQWCRYLMCKHSQVKSRPLKN